MEDREYPAKYRALLDNSAFRYIIAYPVATYTPVDTSDFPLPPHLGTDRRRWADHPYAGQGETLCEISLFHPDGIFGSLSFTPPGTTDAK